MNNCGTAFVLAGFVLVSSQVLAQANVESVHFAGGGCPPSSLNPKLVDSDKDGRPDGVTFRFSNKYTARQGPGISITERRKNCNINLLLTQRPGFQYSIADATHTGTVKVPGNVKAWQRTTYLFPLQPSGTVRKQTVLPGPYAKPYRRKDTLGVKDQLWSPCGLNVPLSIRTQVYLDGSASLQANATLDLLKVQLKWRRCPPT